MTIIVSNVARTTHYLAESYRAACGIRGMKRGAPWGMVYRSGALPDDIRQKACRRLGRGQCGCFWPARDKINRIIKIGRMEIEKAARRYR